MITEFEIVRSEFIIQIYKGKKKELYKKLNFTFTLISLPKPYRYQLISFDQRDESFRELYL
jgi:hypothetical protein